MKSLTIKYGDQFFDCEYGSQGQLEKVWLVVGMGFSVDGIDVTLFVNDRFREIAEERYSNEVLTADEDRAYERFKAAQWE